MNRLSNIYILFLCFLGFGKTGIGQTNIQETLRQEINKIIRYECQIDYTLTPGFIVALIEDDSTEFVSFGRHIDSESMISENDIFELGSLTKVIIPELFLMPETENKNGIHQAVEIYLPDQAGAPYLENLHINQILKHQTNFTKRPKGFGVHEQGQKNPYASYTLDHLNEYLLSLNQSALADRCSYSHTNYGILELMYGLQLNKTASKFFNKFGMYHSSFNKVDALTLGIDKSGHLSDPWDFSSFKYSEGLKSTALDLSIFAKHILAKSHDEWQIYLDEKCQSIYNKHYYNTLGWAVIEGLAKYDIFAITGNTNRHSGFMAFIKETKTAVIVLSNSSTGTKNLGMEILRTLNDNWKRKK